MELPRNGETNTLIYIYLHIRLHSYISMKTYHDIYIHTGREEVNAQSCRAYNIAA